MGVLAALGLASLLMLAGLVHASAPAAFPSDVVEVSTTEVQPNVFQTVYRLPLRPLTPGEVLSTDARRTLLRTPPGKNSILNVRSDVVNEKAESVPLSQLYMHHFVMRESTGTPVETVLGGGHWPAPFGATVYSDLAAQGLSFSAGPCNQLPQTRGGGAEFRGVGAQLAFDPSKPVGQPEVAWVFDSDTAVWGLNIHAIDLRGVDTCGGFEGNHWNYPDFPGTPSKEPWPCAPKGNASLMTGVSQCIQCYCIYYALNNNASIGNPEFPMTGGLDCCPDGSFCDLGGKFTAPDGGLLYPADRRKEFSSAALPDGEPWEVQYSFQYTVTWTPYQPGTRALIQSLLTIESAEYGDQNGFACPAEYMTPTCGACAGKSCGAIKDYYSSVISGVFGPGAEGYEGGSAPSQTTPWSSLSVCESAVVGGQPVVTNVLSYSWTVTTDIDAFYGNGHLHVGGLSLRVYASGPQWGESESLLCESLPTYVPAGQPQAGFIVNMSLCDWREAPLRISKGTKLRVAARYWADSESPFPMSVGDGGHAPHWAQMPWTGAMGYFFLQWVLAPGAQFAWFTVDGTQPVPDAAKD